MGLTDFERCAAQAFRDDMVRLIEGERSDSDTWTKCSPHVKFYRHECEKQVGRTRSIALADIRLMSPEIWVTWSGDALRVISPEEAQSLVAAGTAIEYEVILAGKFSYTWKRGKCVKCRLSVISDGVLRDARPAGQVQSDLATFSQGMQLRSTRGLKREHE